jgi:hypothetical protein
MREGELRFWLHWMLANIPAWVVGAFLFWALADKIVSFALGPGAVAAFGAVLGLVVGTAQWLVLRRHVPGAGWWVAASVVAGALGLAVSDALSHVGAVALVLGAVIGAVQWPVLRRWVGRAGWWVPANMAAWLAGRMIAWTVATFVSLTASGFFDWGLGLRTGLVLGMALGGMVACAITGGVFVWLLRGGASFGAAPTPG